MKKFIFILTIFFFILSANSLVLADSTSYSAYFGADLDQQTTTLYEKQLSSSKYKFLTVNDISTIWQPATNPSLALGGLKLIPQANLEVQTSIDPKSNLQIDNLGYLDVLLTLGIYHAQVHTIISDIPSTFSQSIAAYRDFGYTIESSRIKDARKGLDIYTTMVMQTKSVGKVSDVFFNIEKGIMADPDLGFATNTIVDTSLKRDNITLPDSTKQSLYAWSYQYSKDGNSWNGFFREINPYEVNKNGSIQTNYQVLFSALSQIPDQQATSKKILTVTLFLAFVACLVYLVYKTRKYNHIS